MGELTLFDPGTHVAGRYEILERREPIAEEIVDFVTYSARDSVDLRQRMLLQIEVPADPAERKAFLDHLYAEGERLQALVDPRLPGYSEVFVEKGCAWIVRHAEDGQLFVDAVQDLQEVLPAAQARYRFQSACEVVALLHEHTAPIYLDGFSVRQWRLRPRDVVALTDLGLSRFFPDDQRARLLQARPQCDHVPVAVRAAEGERADGEALRSRIDVWALGAFGCWLLTGEVPSGSPVDLGRGREDLDPELRSILERCLGWGEEPAFKTVREVLRWLRGEAQHEIVLPPEASLRPSGLRFTNLTREEVTVSLFNVVNLGGGELVGRLESSSPWLKVSPTDLTGNETAAQVWLDSSLLESVVEAEGQIRLTSNGGDLMMPVVVSFAASRLRTASAFLLSLVFLLAGFLPQAALLRSRIGLAERLAELERASRALSQQTLPAFDLAHANLRLLRIEFALLLLVPVFFWLLMRGIPFLDRRPLRPALLLAILTPALLSPAWFYVHPLSLGFPSSPAILLQLNPHYAEGARGFIALCTAFLLLVPPERYPGRFGTHPELRLAAWIVLFLGYLQAVRTFCW